MLQMAFEREVITSIRYRVEAHDKQSSFNSADSGLDADVSVRSHVQPGSLDNIIHLKSYAKKLNADINLQDLQQLLTMFLRLNCVLATEYVDISTFQVHAISTPVSRVLTLTQLVPCHVLRVTYDCQETAVKTDLLHVTTSWCGSGARYDCAILRGSGPSGLIFCQVCAIFLISVANEWYRLAVVRIYERKRRNKLTGHIELVPPRDGYFDLCFVDSIVRIAHILPPTSHTPRSIVQDLYDGDMYLRLCSMQ